ncbi:hypothetical protein DYB32_008614, partial [Aphanomyces invadans]
MTLPRVRCGFALWLLVLATPGSTSRAVRLLSDNDGLSNADLHDMELNFLRHVVVNNPLDVRGLLNYALFAQFVLQKFGMAERLFALAVARPQDKDFPLALKLSFRFQKHRLPSSVSPGRGPTHAVYVDKTTQTLATIGAWSRLCFRVQQQYPVYFWSCATVQLPRPFQQSLNRCHALTLQRVWEYRLELPQVPNNVRNRDCVFRHFVHKLVVQNADVAGEIDDAWATDPLLSPIGVLACFTDLQTSHVRTATLMYSAILSVQPDNVIAMQCLALCYLASESPLHQVSRRAEALLQQAAVVDAKAPQSRKGTDLWWIGHYFVFGLLVNQGNPTIVLNVALVHEFVVLNIRIARQCFHWAALRSMHGLALRFYRRHVICSNPVAYDLASLVRALKYHNSVRAKYDADPTRPAAVTNYALHVHTFERAKELYKEALAVSKHHVLSSCYALFLLAVCQPPRLHSAREAATRLIEARRASSSFKADFRVAHRCFFRYALVVFPHEPWAWLNYALLMECIYEDAEVADLMYQRGLALQDKLQRQGKRRQSSTDATATTFLDESSDKFDAALCMHAIQLVAPMVAPNISKQCNANGAVAMYQTVLDASPRHPHASWCLGLALLSLGRMDEATQLIYPQAPTGLLAAASASIRKLSMPLRSRSIVSDHGLRRTGTANAMMDRPSKSSGSPTKPPPPAAYRPPSARLVSPSNRSRHAHILAVFQLQVVRFPADPAALLHYALVLQHNAQCPNFALARYFMQRAVRYARTNDSI